MNLTPISTFRNKAPVVWITGMSGAGKSTIAHAVVREMRAVWPMTILVDGDSVREICGHDLSYNREDRLANAYRIARMCKFLHEQGALVICSTISLFHEIHEWNRREFSPYIETYIRVDVAELQRRNSKGVYTDGARSGGVAGVDQVVEEPQQPDLILTNRECSDLVINIEAIIREIYRHVCT